MSALVSGDTPQKHKPVGSCLMVEATPSEGDFEGHFMLTSAMQAEIKDEPPEDINDTPGNADYDYAESFGLGSIKPQIKLTPTMKLLACPNPVDPKRKFPCPYDNCTKSYGKSSHLRSHLTWHTGIKPYMCQEPNCGKSFTRSDELNRHSRTHTGEKPFECMQCSKKFSRSDHLTKHVATHTKQLQTQKRARTKDHTESPPTKKGQSELTEMLPLPTEGMNYKDGMHFMASLLESTQYKTEETITSEEAVGNMPMPIKIKLERPGNSEEYKVVKSDGAASDTTENDSSSPEKSPIFSATLIPGADPVPSSQPMVINAANQPDDLVEDDHADDDRNDNDIMPEANAPPLPQAGAPKATPRFDEDDDGDDFGNGEPERPYQCNECSKCFKRQDDLNRHMRTHTGEKPFSCIECKRRFNRSDHLKKHLKTHIKKEQMVV